MSPLKKRLPLKEICPCITEEYRNAFSAALTGSITDFEKISANIQKSEQLGEDEEYDVVASLRNVIKDYKRYRDEVGALPTCKNWHLVGTEPDKNKAEIWATHMREHGEIIKIEGDKLYRQ